MAYVTQAEVETAIPPQHLVDALDDDRDGSADDGVLAAVIAQSSQAVDAYLQGRYEVPFTSDPEPSAVRESAFVFTCELIYARRGALPADNPFTKRADFWRTQLQKIGAGDLPLDASSEAAFTPGAAVTEDCAVDDTTR